MSKDIYIYGAGGHAKVVAATAKQLGYRVSGFWEDSRENIGKTFQGSLIIPFEKVPAGAFIFIAFGNNQLRQQKGEYLKKSFKIPTLVHPSAQVAEDVNLGEGCYIGACANIDPSCTIGDFCIINNGANLSHDTIIESGCHICGGVQIAGHCHIKQKTMLGIGSCVIENISIGKNCMIGAGATVVREMPDGIIAVGTPAKIIKKM